ncbi:MAG: UDP-N-acetylglucosamine--N-acetylmuramyl-(pentapeptide) pyrophosphoryl-undecaprenol N-acetylglucosamine transferase [Alphaproteobacteria bacterium]|nr:UDP-N-acetylglucosamine--N-acetylmuramyl-(pentapeptide) pyrophosphoryl-undecaprenol N-acetylglucosamine transferase [Alphaproteobacteria bacterium]
MTVAQDEKPLVVIAAGGTGGHMFPAQAFADEMRSRGWTIALVTDERGEKYALDFPADWKQEVDAATFGSRAPHKLISAVIKLRTGTAAARRKFLETRPKLIAGFGGYPSYPSLSAARALGLPIIIHEQNSVLGRVNRLFAGSARFVACGFDRLDRLPATAAGNRRVVGNPVRSAIRAVRDLPYPDLPDGGRTGILVTGGSQGARLFGEVIPAAIVSLSPQLRARLSIVHQAREEQVEAVRAIYAAAGVEAIVQSFFSDMQLRLAAAHLVIARAGASTVTELAIVGRPSILIPLAIAMDDHQTANAEGMVRGAAADVLSEDKFNPVSLAALLTERLGNAGVLRARAKAALSLGRPNAARDLADLAEEAAGVTGKADA